LTKDRQKRLAEALRENLKRRKQQIRDRAGRAQPDRDALEGAEPDAEGVTRKPTGNADERG
jgi:hypothetical protein